MKPNAIYRSVVILLVMIFSISGCKTHPEEITFSRTSFVLGTVVDVNLFDHGSDELLDTMEARLQEIENTMSVNVPSSEVNLINDNAGIKSVQVSDDTYNVIKKSIEYSVLSHGAFDVTFGPIVNLWQIGTDQAAVPDDQSLAEALALVDYNNIELLDDNYVYLTEQDMRIDLGGIAKGFAADEIIEIAKKAGVESALVNLGGNVKTLGLKVDGKPYNVGIQNPFDMRNAYLGIVSVSDQTVVTSGDYERYFTEDGVRYHHIFDYRTGYPVVNGLGSVTLISSEAIDADALSTALYVLGADEGTRLIETLDGIECLYVTYDNEIYVSSGLKSNFTITDRTFSVVN
jgi:thiamine biosynthesis lipoprotein